MKLRLRKCGPCTKDTPALSSQEITSLLSQTPDWKIEEGKLERTFVFPDYLSGIDFVGKVAKVAEAENHHPEILVGFKKVKVSIFTHAIGALSENDFILATKIDPICEAQHRS